MSVRGDAEAGQRAEVYQRAEALLAAMADLVERREEIPPQLADELDACLAQLRALGAGLRRARPAAGEATSPEGSR